MRLLGHRADVPDLLAAADVVVSSAVWEGQPVGIQEALHAGAAVVATDVGGTGGRRRRRRAARAPGATRCRCPGRSATSCVHGAVRDDLRSKAVERAAHLPTERDALEAALAAYRSVLAGERPRPERRSEGWEPGDAPGVSGRAGGPA